MNKLIICGDSYNAGIGCINMHTQPYGVLTANHFDWEHIILARGSASNYAVYLQAMYAADMEDTPHLIIISQTSYDRVEWIKETRLKPPLTPLTLHNLNYHQYPPHHHPQPHHSKPMPFYLQNDKNYDPILITEQIGAIDDYLIQKKKYPEHLYYQRLFTEPVEKLELIRDYYAKCIDYAIKRDNDIGLLLQAYTYIKRKGLNCIVLTHDTEIFCKYIDRRDIMFQDWGELSIRYPDAIKSLHTSELGHIDTANRLIAKIEENKLNA